MAIEYVNGKTDDYIVGTNGEKIASHNCKIVGVRN